MKKKEGFEGVPATLFAYEGCGGGEEEVGFYWECDDLPFSPRVPKEFKMQHTLGLLVKGILCLIPSAAALLFCSVGY